MILLECNACNALYFEHCSSDHKTRQLSEFLFLATTKRKNINLNAFLNNVLVTFELLYGVLTEIKLRTWA